MSNPVFFPPDIVESYIECKNEQDPQNFSKVS